MASSFNTGQVTVEDSATQIVTQNTGRNQVTIQNLGATTVYIGPNKSVSTSNGYPLAENGSIIIPSTSAIWGIVETDSQAVSFLDV